MERTPMTVRNRDTLTFTMERDNWNRLCLLIAGNIIPEPNTVEQLRTELWACVREFWPVICTVCDGSGIRSTAHGERRTCFMCKGTGMEYKPQ